MSQAAQQPLHVGRDAEIEALLAAVRSPPALVVVEGEAGVGKTRLIRELSDRLHARRRPRLLIGHAAPLADPFPLAPVVSALGTLGSDIATLTLSPLAGALRPLLPDLGDLLPPQLESLGDPAMERHRMLRAIGEVLSALGHSVFVLEDLHWSDEATFELVCLLAAQPIDTLSVVVTHRPEDTSAHLLSKLRAACSAARTHLTRISLRPLGQPQVAVFVSALLDTEQMSDEFTSYLYGRSGGLPLAVQEIVQLLRERQDVVRLDQEWVRRTLDDIRVPDAISDLVLERFERLPAPARVVIEAAAVLGVPAPRELIAKVAGLMPARAIEAITTATSSNFLQEDERGLLAFGHVLFKEAIYDALDISVRRRMHLRGGQLLAKDPRSSPAQLARHFRECDRPTRWLHYTEAAADLASSLGNEREATSFLIEALNAPRVPVATRTRLALKLASSALEALTHVEAVPVLERVLDDPSLSPGDRGEIRIGMALLLDQGGDSSAGHRELAAALPEVRRRPIALANAYKNLACLQVIEGHVDHHLEWLERLAQVLEAHPHFGDWHLLVDRADLHLAIGDCLAWHMIDDVRHIERTGAMSHDWVRITANLAINAYHLGHYQAARSFIAEGIALSEQLAFPRVASGFRATELLLDHATGQWQDLEQRAASLLGTLPQVPHVVVDVELVLGLSALARGDLVLAEQILQEVIRTARGTGSVPVLAHASAALARIHLARGRYSEAVLATTAALEVIAGKGIWVWAAQLAPVAVESLTVQIEMEQAEAVVRWFAAGIEGRDAPAADAALTQCRGILAAADPDAIAEDSFTRAEAMWVALPHPYHAAWVREQWGQALLGSDQESAVDHLVEVIARYRTLGASWDEARVRRVLAVAGAKLPHPWSGGRRGYGDELSPRELEVAGLAAKGLTNREIGLELNLSPRTVGHHVARVLQKLSLSSRRALASPEVVGKIGHCDRTQAVPSGPWLSHDQTSGTGGSAAAEGNL